MQSGRFNFRSRGLQIKQRPSARRASHVIRLKNSRTGGLENVVTQAQRLPWRFFTLNQNGVTDSIAKQRANVGRRNQQRVQK